MCDDSLWSDYDYYQYYDDPPLTGEEYKKQLDDETLDSLDYLAMLLEELKK